MERPLGEFRPFGPAFELSQEDTQPNETEFLDSGDRRVSPLVVLRKFREGVMSDLNEQQILTEMGTLSWDTLGSFVRVELSFNESQIENTFSFTPIGAELGGGERVQGTPAPQLGGDVGRLAKRFAETYDSAEDWEFSDLEAASIGQTNLTSYEFTYRTTVSGSDVSETDPGEV